MKQEINKILLTGSSGTIGTRLFEKLLDKSYEVIGFDKRPYDNSDRFVPLMIKKMQKNQDVIIYGENKILDFTYIDDCVKGIIKSIERFPKIKNNTFNIASSKGEKLIKVAQFIKKNLNSNSEIIIKPSRTGEVVQYIADISKAKRMLDYKPNYPIKKGMYLTINWYIKNI